MKFNIRNIFLMAAVFLVAACDSLTPVPITLTPTRQFSAPTLEPSLTPDIRPPTAMPLGMSDRGQNSDQAAGLPAHAELPPVVIDSEGDAELVRVTLADGRTIEGEFYLNSPVQTEAGMVRERLPGIILLAPSLDEWQGLPQQLRDAGFTVITMPTDLSLSSEGVSQIIRALSQSDAVDPARIGVIGASEGADLGLIGCSVQSLCDALIMLSPMAGDTLRNVLPDYGLRPMFVFASVEDDASSRAAIMLQSSGNDLMEVDILDASGRGTELLSADPGLIARIVGWMQGRFLS